ncbi:MAG: DegT/DnrJ/EryC1/StrS family aminotransferase [Elusimicrobia bacterium]|nr:DegT/DnrJ/EryC1/StrS family aminotransferase [Elusimicrobiota bacterium]
MRIQMVDLKASYTEIGKEIDAAVKNILSKSNFILGEEVKIFEEEFARYCGVKYAVGVANGTDALKIAVLACGLKKGDEVITVPFTFIATTEAIVQAGCVPVFADIDPKTYTLDPKKVEECIQHKIRNSSAAADGIRNLKAILPVHMYGHPGNMEEILKIAKKHDLKVIEDCAQSFSAKYMTADSRWQVAGSIGDVGCFSFFPAKNLGCFGDGGMVITNDNETYENAKALRNHGQRKKYYSEMDGFNSRLDTLQAAILSVKLKYIDKWTEMRNKVAQKYNELLKDTVAIPTVSENCRHSFNYYTIRFKNKAMRDKVQKHLLENEVACQIYYPQSLHLQKVYEEMGCKKGDFPVSERMQDETLSLPMYPELDGNKIKYITDKIKDVIV